MTDPIISLKCISKSFIKGSIETKVLQKIDLNVISNDYLGISGPSGSGKSTLLNIICGIESPSSGELSGFHGFSKALSVEQKANWRLHHLGIVFQHFNLLPTLSIFENVALPLGVLGFNKKDQKEKVETALEQVGFADRMNHLPEELSGGEMQRAGIARAVVHTPKLLIADEPTGNLDRETSDIIMTLFDKLNKKGQTIVLVSHSQSVLNHCHTNCVLKDGYLIENA